MNPDADLSPPGMVAVIVAFMDALGLERATIVGNDTGGAISQMLAADAPRAGRAAGADQLRHVRELPAVPVQPDAADREAARRDDRARRAVSDRPDPALHLRACSPSTRSHRDLVDSWLEPGGDPGVRRDTRKLTVGVEQAPHARRGRALRGFERPVRFAWGTEDRFFKLSQAERLAATVPDARVDDRRCGHLRGARPARAGRGAGRRLHARGGAGVRARAGLSRPTHRASTRSRLVEVSRQSVARGAFAGPTGASPARPCHRRRRAGRPPCARRSPAAGA